MATYVNDLRLKEIATGDESGTWGTSTNTNLELIAEAFSFGTEAITTNADTHTTTIADGSTDPGRSLYLKYTGTLDSACTITIGPNTVSKLWFIENGTSGSQNIIISQGSGANVTIPAGDVKAVYSDGAGSGAAIVDAFTDLNLAGTTTVSVLSVSSTTTFSDDVTFTGASNNLVWDKSDDCLEFADNAKAKFGASDDLQIYHDGSNSRIQEGGTGSLLVRGTNLQLQDSDGFDYLTCTDGGDGGTVALKHLGSTVLSTAVGGITVTSAINDMTIAAGNIQTNTSNNLSINTPNSLRINIDSNNSATDQVFVIGHNQTAVDTSNALMTILESGNVGIGTSGPAQKLHVNSGTSNLVARFESSDSIAVASFKDNNGEAEIGNIGNDIGFYPAGAEKVRITSAGNLLVGATSFNAGAFGSASGINVAGTQPLVLVHETDTDKDGFMGISASVMFLGTADAIPLRFSTNDAERMRIASNGSIGMGTNPPSDTHTGWTQLFIGQKGSVISENATGVHGLDGTFLTDNMYVDTDTGSFANIETNQSSAYRQEAGEHIWYSQTSGSAGAGVTLSQVMEIDNNGKLLLGTTSGNPVNIGDHRQVVELSSSIRGIAVGADGLVDTRTCMTFYNDNGVVGSITTNASSTAFNTSSDYRLKENVNYTWDATSRLKQLKPARFNFKADKDTTLDGFLAHEVSSIVPESVTGEKDGAEMQGIDQSKLVPLLVKTIQELEARITALES